MVIRIKDRTDQFVTLAYYGAWFLLLVVAVVAYWPGLSGPFLFDDFGSLAALGNLGGVRDWFTFKVFVFGDTSGPTGRPLALVSFLIDGNNWPTDAWPFKRSNLAIHLVNGVILGVIIARVLCIVRIDKKRAQWLALICAGMWLLHPFLVSTTLYAVQRMAQLSTLFIFLAIFFYLHGRAVLEKSPVKAYVVISLAVGLGTLLATFSKENGILLPLLILVLEFTIFSGEGKPGRPLNRKWITAFLVAPSAVVVSYLGLRTINSSFFEQIPWRDFSTYERLLTEPRILVDYLRHWFAPELYTVGVFQDHFVKSTGFLSPITTALSVVFHLLLITVCVIRRRKWPLFAFGVLFFYASHMLESTVLDLELYFEHRNYLAAAFLFPPLIAQLRDRTRLGVFAAVAVLVLLVMAGFTRYTATVWESYPKIVEASAKKAPTSARAQRQYSLLLFNEQKYNEALQVTDAAIARIPNDEQLDIWRSIVLCNLGILTDADFQQMKHKVAAKIFDPRALGLYTALVNSVINQKCPAVSLESLRGLFTDMLSVPLNADARSLRFSQIKYFTGLIDIHMREPARAVRSFEESLNAQPGPSQAMQMASLMASGEFYEEALHLSAIALTQLHDQKRELLAGVDVSEQDIMAFRENVQSEWELRQKP